ncbi:MAG: N-6 DNA methylase, partial [Bacteroidetes bacterium]|nr:N-6 DNA methylase [Bacteroidota bacterium]
MNKNDDKIMNGVYYTPPVLANFLVQPILGKKIKRAFDPSYGEGSLLRAVKENFINSDKLEISGCDINASKKDYLNTDFHLQHTDFFYYPVKKEFDLIVMNPPYVRHHSLNREKLAIYHSFSSKYCKVNKKSDLWVYFLIKSCLHLREGGSIAGIFPLSILHADYAIPIRAFLYENFYKIKVL